MKELEVRLPQIRYALEFNDPEFGLKHLRHLEAILSSQPKEISEIPNLEELGLSEEDVEEFGKLFLKNVDELAEIDE